ncbi:hypothetical protein NOV72_00517 [Caballeronia novacaledonica]|uniref:Uncharacterized protein n=1 Tax=Caballeronia novacaledonica TaxID=1544861 RepID=A0A2U3HZJ2_9BURK|nr:hypothetical protein [Caballeronia novacaledonica]SPB13220.1 hypothetical protein NOV72_00517 [Caballeronia novacaledonica]
MRRKSSGFAVAAVLVGVAVAAVLYIASFGRSRHADAPVPTPSALAAQDGAASAAFGAAPKHPEAAQGERTAAR